MGLEENVSYIIYDEREREKKGERERERERERGREECPCLATRTHAAERSLV